MIGYSYHITTTIVIFDYYVLTLYRLASQSLAAVNVFDCYISHNITQLVQLLLSCRWLHHCLVYMLCTLDVNDCVAVQAAAGLMLMGTCST